MEFLPPLYRDAFKICHNLHIPFLWIDSLCIVQDDKKDWEVESSHMSDYYHDSYITIAADMCKDPNVSLLTYRDEAFLPRNFTVWSRKGVPWSVRTREHGTSTLLDGPLRSRAWVFQEHVLSRRILHFTSRQIIWECNTTIHSEDSEMDQELIRPEVEGLRLNTLLHNFDNNPFATWSQIVFVYTCRKLTYSTDKLPALSGVASRFQRLTGFSYLAGLWKETLEFDLC